MDVGDFQAEATFGPPSDSAMELDYMDELLLAGCWLETTDGSDFFIHGPSSSRASLENSPQWPMLEDNNSKSRASQSEKSYQNGRQESETLENAVLAGPSQVGALVNRSLSPATVSMADCSIQSGNAEGSELNRMFWIGPRVNPGPASSVMERLVRALSFIKGSTKNKDVLIQIWVPVNRSGARVLTTSHQPFSIGSTNPRLANYRNISVNYQFAAEENSSMSLGLPGRVFTGKVPEWTPDVRFFRVDEYPRVGHAQEYDVRGTLALPVFEQGSRTCLGVIEVVTTNQKLNYQPELETVCRALEAVDLRSSEYLGAQSVRECNNSYQAALPEILDVLKSACATHGLPLTQTWVPCIQQGKQGCRHSDENLIHCISTVDSACFVADPNIQPFHEACSEHHLLKGQGVTGKAFMTNQPRFSEDITAYGKTEYPLSHHARMFGLCAAVAIRLRSMYTGASDFVLEFFLPSSCRDPVEQKKMLTSLSIVIQRVCRSLRVLRDEELEQENVLPASNVTFVSDESVDREKMSKVENSASASSPKGESSGFSVQPNNDPAVPILKEEDKTREVLYGKGPEPRQNKQELMTAGCSLPNMGRSGEKKRSKAERAITLEVLRQHFAGSLRDAAKSLGVCPTTLKRICRQHGIQRWPSRKIKKVGHSLQKLQVVMDSVQGASGALQIGSFYSNFPELASPNLSGTKPFSSAKSCLQPQPPSQEPEGGNLSPRTAMSKSPSSSCSQGSSSSQSCSTGTQQHPLTWHGSAIEDPLAGPSTSECTLTRSEVELHASSPETRKSFQRSQSQIALLEHQNVEILPPLPKHEGIAFREVDAWRVKVAYGDEKIRFRMLKGWGFKDLVQEVVRRFNIGDISGFHLKYLDDDSEWVLLTCDADLEECVDICQYSERQTIKLSLQVSSHHSRSSAGSNSQL
ncbi:hypothetical protein Ancab_007034 [Ancistrocladus abbreviatus]